jgi:hypothetical protein
MSSNVADKLQAPPSTTGYFYRDDPALDLSRERERVERDKFNRLPLKPDFPTITAENLHSLAAAVPEPLDATVVSDFHDALRQLQEECDAILSRARNEEAHPILSMLKQGKTTSGSLHQMSPEMSIQSASSSSSQELLKNYNKLRDNFDSTFATVQKRMDEIKRKVAEHRSQSSEDSDSSPPPAKGSTVKSVKISIGKHRSSPQVESNIDSGSKRRRADERRR